MRANYGYSDASGDYFLTIDTDLCDGCESCVEVCPSGMLEVLPDDYDKPVVRVKEGLSSSIGYVCLPCGGRCLELCTKGAIEKKW